MIINPYIFGTSTAPPYVGYDVEWQIANAETNLSDTISAVTAGAAEGDLMLLFISATGFTDSQGIANITGWTLQASATGTGSATPDYKLFSRVMQAGDTTWNYSCTDAYQLLGTLVVFRNASGLGNRRVTQSTGDTASEITSTTAGSSLAILCHFNSSGAAVPDVTAYPGTSTEIHETKTSGTSTYFSTQWAGYEEGISGGGTGTRAFTVADNTKSIFVLQEILA